MFTDEILRRLLLQTYAWSSVRWTPQPLRYAMEKGTKTSFCNFTETWSGEA